MLRLERFLSVYRPYCYSRSLCCRLCSSTLKPRFLSSSHSNFLSLFSDVHLFVLFLHFFRLSIVILFFRLSLFYFFPFCTFACFPHAATIATDGFYDGILFKVKPSRQAVSFTGKEYRHSVSTTSISTGCPFELCFHY
jgi:hypothetical protein